jgi:hypothetical protein
MSARIGEARIRASVDGSDRGVAARTPRSSTALKAIVILRLSKSVTSLLWAVGLATAIAIDATSGERTGNARDQHDRVGVFTGRFADGMPIYRLPSITVVARRKAEPANREEQYPRETALSRPTGRTATGVVKPSGGG